MGIANTNEEEVVVRNKDIKLLGRNVLEVTCFRSSFICGICTGVAGGLITFMMTSKAMMSTHVAFASLWVGVFIYWIPCRYQYESKVYVMEKAKQIAKKEKVVKYKEDATSNSSESSEDSPAGKTDGN